MKKLKNQTLYQCEYCNKRLLTKQGAEIHETQYCKNIHSPCQEAKLKFQAECKHENIKMMYHTMEGECIQEPHHEECVDCGAWL